MTKITSPFASTQSLRSDIPQTTTAQGYASMEKGFPEETMRPLSQQGIPPRGQDFNGILYAISSDLVDLNLGIQPKYNARMIELGTGYNKGYRIALNDGETVVMSLIDGNKTDPNKDMKGWKVAVADNQALLMTSCFDLNALRNVVANQDRLCYVTSNDISGVFKFEEKYNKADDNATVVKSNVKTGAWVRLGYQSPCLSWFSNPTDALYSLGGKLNVNKSVTLTKSGAINSTLEFINGAQIVVPNNITLTVNTIVAEPQEKVVFKTSALSAVKLPKNAFVSLGWFGHNGDWGALVSSIISSASQNGMSIFVPNGAYYLKTAINLADKSFIKIYGESFGQRSNIEYEKKPPFGNGAVTTYPSSGAKFYLDQNSANCIYRPQSVNKGFRSSGICIEGITFSGHNAPKVAQTGIRIEEDNDGYLIKENVFINFRGFGLFIKGNDALTLKDNWVCECENPLYLQGGKESIIQGNIFGGFPTGISCDIQDQVRLNFTGNNIPPDGSIALNLNKCRDSIFSNNVITGRFVGLLRLVGSFCNNFNSNIYRIPQDEATTMTSTDPKGRDSKYGVIRLELSDDNIFSDSQLLAYLTQNTACTIRVTEKSKNNIFSNIRITNKVASQETITLDSGTSNNQLLNSCRKTELTDKGTNNKVLIMRE